VNERRTGLEKGNVSVEPAEKGRRPQLTLEVSITNTESGRRGNGVDMSAKEKTRQHRKLDPEWSKSVTARPRGTGPAGLDGGNAKLG
jgi:hypothetical protein